MTLAEPSDRARIGGKLYVQASETIANPVNAAQNTTIFDARAFKRKIFYLENATNQTVVFTLQSISDIGAAADARTVSSGVSLSAGGKETVHLSDYHPYLRWNIDPAADATGNVIIKVAAQE